MIILLYVFIFLVQGWFMGVLLKDIWDADECPLHRVILVALGIAFYLILVTVVWKILHE